MSSNFPVHNLRQSIDSQWEQVEITQSITVPNDGEYTIKLLEVPDNGSVNTDIIISGLSKSNTYPPLPGQYYVNYNTGYVGFDVSDAGNTFTVVYWGKGSLIESDDINYLNNKYVINSVPPSGYYGQQYYNLNTGRTLSFDIRDKWLSINRPVISFGRKGLTNNQYLNYFGGTLPSNNSGLRMVRDACIVSLSAQFSNLGTGTFYIRKNNNNSAITSIDIFSDYGRSDDNINIDVNEGDIIQCYFDSMASTIHDPMILLEIAWRN